MTAIRLIGLSCAALALIQFPPVVSADELDSAVSKLEACVLEELDAERSKKQPQAEQVLKACDVDYRAMLAKLPPGGEENIVRFVRHQIHELLKQ